MRKPVPFNAFLGSTAAALLIAVLVCWYVPLEIFAANPIDFASDWPVLVGQLAGWGLALWLVLLLPALAPSAWRRGYAKALLALALLLWISATWVVSDFGLLDGSSFDLRRHSGRLTWQSLLMAAIFLSLLYASRRWPAAALRLATVLSVGLLVYPAFLLSRLPPREPVVAATEQHAELFRFSRDKNLLIVMMDTFQSDFFDTFARQQSAVAEQLEGFVYYPDTLGVAPSTYLTMPAFHSGQAYDYESSLKNYYDQAIRRGSFFSQLADRGYQVDLVNAIAGACPRDARCVKQALIVDDPGAVARSDAGWLLDLGVFRAAPGWIKAWVFDGASGVFSRAFGNPRAHGEIGNVLRSDRLLELYSDRLTADDGPATARLIHLFNTHPPFVLNGQCEFSGYTADNNRRLMSEQVRCALRRFVQLLKALKTAGVYDQTMIVLVADTGAGSQYAAADLANRFATDLDADPEGIARIMGGANPVLAIKPRFASDKLRTSARAAQLTDAAATVCAALQDCQAPMGRDLNDPSWQPPASRRYNYYLWENAYWGLSSIPGIQAYDVSGPLWEETSWKRALIGEGEQPVWEISFSAEDKPHWFGLGWGKPEVNLERKLTKRWATAKTAELILPLQQGQDLNFTFQVYRVPDLDKQTITMSLNGEPLGSRAIGDGLENISFRAPKDAIRAQMNELKLQFSEIRRPKKRETRSLTTAFFRLSITPA